MLSLEFGSNGVQAQHRHQCAFVNLSLAVRLSITFDDVGSAGNLALHPQPPTLLQVAFENSSSVTLQLVRMNDIARIDFCVSLMEACMGLDNRYGGSQCSR
jgi:hypothetical protein